MTAPISQAEARRLRKRVRELEQERRDMLRVWGESYPGTFVMTMDANAVVESIMMTTARLEYVTVARLSEDRKTVKFYAVRKP
jgi:hypothetical protein